MLELPTLGRPVKRSEVTRFAWFKLPHASTLLCPELGTLLVFFIATLVYSVRRRRLGGIRKQSICNQGWGEEPAGDWARRRCYPHPATSSAPGSTKALRRK
jgi:hypothetical protein